MTEELNQVMKIRREKLDLLSEKGIQPFAYRYSRTHEAGEAHAVFKEEEDAGSLDEKGHGAVVRVAGRLKSFRMTLTNPVSKIGMNTMRIGMAITDSK